MKINDDQLSAIITSQIREQGLDNVFDHKVIEGIKSKIKSEYKRMRAMPEEALLPEANGILAVPGAGNSFPYEDNSVQSDGNEVDAVGIDVEPAMETGAQPTDIAYAPKVYTPELPEILKHVQPAKLVAMELNDVAEGGENLASKPLRTMDDIDTQKSMLDLWKENGATKAEVYIIKYEKAGEMTFDYASGTAVFVPTPSTPEVVDSSDHQANPYAEENPNGPNRFKNPTPEEIETYVKTSVNVEDIVKKVAIELMAKAYQDQNNESAKAAMGMTEPETPQADESIPLAIYESFQLGQSVNGVEFVSATNGVSTYRYKGKEYAIYDSSLLKNRV